MFHYIVENGVTYLCMADEQSRRRVPFAFLEVSVCVCGFSICIACANRLAEEETHSLNGEQSQAFRRGGGDAKSRRNP